MYKLALDFPIKYIDSTLGDMTFALAPLCNDEEYVTKLKKIKQSGRPILMDNGAYELGKSIPAEEYLKIIKKVKPTYAVIPDVLQDGFRTCIEASKFISQRLPTDVQWIFAPQGSDPKEMLNCWDTICGESHEDFILGLPKHVGDWTNRAKLALMLWEESFYKFSKIHLLGFNTEEFGIIRDLRVEGLPDEKFEVISIDTKWPIKNMIPKRYKFKNHIDYYYYDKGLDMQELDYKVRGFKLAIEGKVGMRE
jgi:hypothetical protein